MTHQTTAPRAVPAAGARGEDNALGVHANPSAPAAGAHSVGFHSFFQNKGAALLGGNYLIIPIKPGHKRPALSNWQDSRFGVADLGHYPGHGVGVLCGQGAHPICAIDIDVSIEPLTKRFVDWCSENLGLACERVGNAPKILLAYKAATGGWGKAQSAWFTDNPPKFDAEGKLIQYRVEVLGKGQQFVAYHIHPDTGREYVWTDLFGGIEHNRADDLTVVTEEQVNEALAVFELMAEEYGLIRKAAASKGVAPAAPIERTPVAEDDWFGRVNQAAMDSLGSWVPALLPAAREYNGGFRVASCDLNRDLEEDLSIAPTGIVDFGVADMGDARDGKRTPIDLVLEWAPQTFDDPLDAPMSPREAAEWLCAQIGVPKEELGWKGYSQKLQGRDAIEAARREYQKQEAERIGEGDSTIPAAEVVTLQEALDRFIFLSDGSRVADLMRPHFDLALSDWAATYAASAEMIPQPEKVYANGGRVQVPDKEVPVSKLWMASPHRKTVVTRTFKAGGPLLLNDPEGRPAFNSWRPFDRTMKVIDTSAAKLFLDHVHFLFGADADRFLDWLAHIEQQPGVLPHTSWLHIATSFGMGRNWLASVLARVWAGSVAANLDLVEMFEKGYNGRLSRKVLAIVDEIHEGGRDSRWQHSEKLKRIVNEESRLINPKYGRQSVEYNACRWLMLSNHLSAIPMEKGDRRVEVVATEAKPNSSDYYAKLYTALDDPRFIASVAKVLGERDISRFNPGAHARDTASKQAATKASQTPTAAWCEMLQEHWPGDLITSSDLTSILAGGDEFGPNRGLTAEHRRTLEQYGIKALGKPVKVDNTPTRVTIVRNKEDWLSAAPDAVRKELEKVKCEGSPRHYLELLAAVG